MKQLFNQILSHILNQINLLNCEQITEAQPESNIEPNPGTDDQIEYQRKDYKCESCGKSFSQACDLKKHIYTIHYKQVP